MKQLSLIITIFSLLFPMVAAAADNAAKPSRDTSTRKERNFIRQGNKHYNEKHFSEAEVQYRKALEENELSEAGQYNLAAALIRQAGNADPNNGNNPMAEAQTLLNDLARTANNVEIAEKAFYNLGNMAFNQQQYDQAISMYKGALRKNPDNDKARENLRLAQLKRQQQQQDKNQDKNQDKQENKQDQQQNQQQNQDQKQDNKDQQQQPQQQQPQQQQPPQQQQGGISDANAAKILKTMENEENATRRKVQEMEKKEGQSSRRTTGPQW
ncbi:MAG: tetratricopeptide repeat protein [Muribaculum sp.]|nr:tetratricopeptide repeat protein [Muribaculaceae bacterium]MCM1080347.1 tetratricopeptide repeat protein [Muribaculum sp.]